ncbi:hypothetical protein [Listeria booriae]|uniref:hypothetical protein n=1 Tax=Listeria booriae TaxID=1552123 RepID=UPI001624A271|nr:hypothetical protein [Listeria booriae]MBC2023086.1 hypothetical protein [Listeria booriae]
MGEGGDGFGFGEFERTKKSKSGFLLRPFLLFGFSFQILIDRLSRLGNHVCENSMLLSRIYVSRSSFNSHPFGAFTASIKIKRGFLLRLLQALSGVNGLSCCGSYEALFAELEPQYAVEWSETAFLSWVVTGNNVWVSRIWRRTWRLRIQLHGLAPRKLHAFHKKQERLFITAAPVFVGAERARSAFRYSNHSNPSCATNLSASLGPIVPDV